MSSFPEYEDRLPRAVPVAMILFGLFGVFVGLLDPSGSGGQRPSGFTPDQMQLIRADTVAGFSPPPHPESPPRGPGE